MIDFRLVKIVFMSSFSTIIKIMSGLIINKCISIYIGPSGLAVIGQFQNISALVQNISTGGISHGVVKYSAEFSGSERNFLWRAAFKIVMSLSLLSGVILIIFSKVLAGKFLLSDDRYYIFIVFGVFLSLFSINQLLLSVLNGLSKTKVYFNVNIIQSVFSAVLTSVLIYFYSLDGALLAMAFNQSMVLFLLFIYLKNDADFNLGNFIGDVQCDYYMKLLKYSMMTLVTVICSPLSTLFIRNLIGEKISWEFAGYWQAMNYISASYLMIVTMVLSVYYLPRISVMKKWSLIIGELLSHLFVLLPLVVFGMMLIYFCREFIVGLLFSDKFYNMLILFKYQLIGDAVKIICCLFSYIFVARSMTRLFITLELVSTISLIIITDISIKLWGFIGLSYAYFMSNLLSLTVFIIVFILIFIKDKDLTAI